MSKEFTTKDEVDVLMREYGTLRGEIIEYVRFFRAHARYVTALLTIAIAVIAFIGRGEGPPAIAHSRLFWFCFATGLTTIVSYLVFDALEAHYAMFAIAGRAATIESMINRRANSLLLLWESKMSGELWWRGDPPPAFGGRGKVPSQALVTQAST